MVHLRRTISLLAVLGLLAQSAAFQRHARATLSAPLLVQLSADLALICHGGNGPAPSKPRGPGDFDRSCAICSSLGSALVDVAAPDVFCAPTDMPTLAERSVTTRAPGLCLRPPVRAPPLMRA